MTDTATLEGQTTIDRLRGIITECLSTPAESINPETKFIEDLGADSLDTVSIVMAAEEEFDIELGDDDLEQVTTVGGLVALIDKMRAE